MASWINSITRKRRAIELERYFIPSWCRKANGIPKFSMLPDLVGHFIICFLNVRPFNGGKQREGTFRLP